MYTITRGPSKLVTQRRTGPTQQLESKINDFKHKQTSWNMPDLPAPKIVFNRLNGRKLPPPVAPPHSQAQQAERFTPAHQDNVKFVFGAWQEVVQQQQEQQKQEQKQEQDQGADRRTIHYRDSTPGPPMEAFVPIDLDEWWAQRFLANIDKLS